VRWGKACRFQFDRDENRHGQLLDESTKPKVLQLTKLVKAFAMKAQRRTH
jgi:hypothetical protein